jgi:hypothetical protein
MNPFAPFAPHPLKGNGAKAQERQRGRTTLLGVGWFLPSLPLACQSFRTGSMKGR